MVNDLRIFSSRKSNLLCCLITLTIGLSSAFTSPEASAQTLTILSPSDGSCLAGTYTVENPLQGGLINAAPVPPGPAFVSVSIEDPTGASMDIKLTASSVDPAFRQPPQALCPDWTFGEDPYAACGAGNGYCIFTQKCICVVDDDCDSAPDAGDGFCRADGVCGCSSNQACGDGQSCNAGFCACLNDSACAENQVCNLTSGVCSCSTSADCGDGLVCSEGVCSKQGEGDFAFNFVPPAEDGEALPRTITREIEIPQSIEDSAGLAVLVELTGFDANFNPVVLASSQIGFKLDRQFPLLTAYDLCEVDADCPVVGESCDLVTGRCFPDAIANIGRCRPTEDFSQGLSADYALSDNLDPTPQLTVLENIVNGCQTTQQLLLQDSCGNAQVIDINSVRAPNQGEVSAALAAYRCISTPCGIDLPLADGETGSRVSVDVDITGPETCFDYYSLYLDPVADNGLPISCSVTQEGNHNCTDEYQCLDELGQVCPVGQNCTCSRTLVNDEILQALPADLLSTREVDLPNGSTQVRYGGPYQLVAGETLTFTDANGETETFTVNADDFFDLNQVLSVEVVIAINQQVSQVVAYLDDNALHIRSRSLGQSVSLTIGGTAAASLGFTEGFNTNIAQGSGNGSFRARLDLYACGETAPLQSDQISFSVSMPFLLNLGGPYEINEGAELNLSAEDLFVSPEVGGIRKIEWDVDGDGVYELEQFFDPPVGELPPEPVDPQAAEDNLTIVTIDTSEQSEFFVSLRVTTGQDESLEARAFVKINDVVPTCVLPQAVYNVREGDPFTFTAPDTTSDPSDAITSYQWNFGDGSGDSSSEPTTQHTYDDAGEYTLTLNATDEDGSNCDVPASALVIVGGVTPIIGEDLGLDPQQDDPVEGSSVRFTAGSTRAGAATDPIQQYTWTFGVQVNGQLATSSGADLVAPEFTYVDEGQYEVCLSVEDFDDQVGPSCFTITIADLKPFVTWDGPLQGIEGQPLSFDSAGTVAGGAADQITSLRWDFSDGGQPQFDAIATHTFSGDGTYVVRLTAFDEDLDDAENYLERQVEILDVSPTARFVINYPDPELELGVEGQPVQLNASASTAGAPSDPIAWYYWNFGDGSEVIRTANPVISHEWPDGPQDYIIELTVEDEDGSQNTTALNLSVANADPVVSISVSRASAEVGSTVTFTLNVDDVAGDQPGTSNHPVAIEWDLGDGTLVNDQASVEHSFEREGTFAIHVRYEDGDGGEGEATFQFTSTPRLATLSEPVVSVINLDGDAVADPREPIREFSDESPTENGFYLKEGEQLSISIQVESARLSNGTLDTASMRWFPVPEGAVPVYTPITPPAGSPNEGDEVRRATVTWQPNFFQAGTWQIQLSVEGEVTGSSLSKTFVVHVAESGTPMVAATSGSLRRGRVVLYRYDLNNGFISFTPSREVNVGRGAYDVIADQERRRLFVSSPLSGHVAVVGGDPAQVLRYIKTGAGAYDMAWGGGMLWVVNVESRTLTAINPNSLKIARTIQLEGMEKPISVLWVGDDQGLARGRVLVGDGSTGELVVLNAQGLLAGEGSAAIEARVSLGGSLTQMVARDGILWVANGKRRVIHVINLENLMVSGENVIVSDIDDFAFSLTDMLATERGLWVATGDKLSLIDQDGFIEGYDYPAERIIEAHPLVVGGEGLTISGGLRLDSVVLNVDGDLENVVGLEGSSAQRLTSFIYYSE